MCCYAYPPVAANFDSGGFDRLLRTGTDSHFQTLHSFHLLGSHEDLGLHARPHFPA